MKKVVLCPNPYRDHGLYMTQKVREILTETGIESVISLPFQPEGDVLPKELTYLPVKTAIKGAGLMIAFGGDGSILHLAKTAAVHHLPILGINLGNLGYIAELESTDIELLRKLKNGKLKREARMMLDVRVFRADKQVYSNIVLNSLHATSLITFDNLLFLSILFTLKSSIAIDWFSLISLVDNLCKKFLR